MAELSIAKLMVIHVDTSADLINATFGGEIGYRDLSKMISRGLQEQMQSKYGASSAISCFANTIDYKIHSKPSETTSSIVNKMQEHLGAKKTRLLNETDDEESARLAFLLMLHAEKSVKIAISMRDCKKFDAVLERMCNKFLTPCMRRR